MKSKPFHSKFFTDTYIQDLSIEEKMVYIYYIFNDKVNWLGTYEISDKVTIFELGIDGEKLEKIKKKLQSDHKIYFYEHWVILVNSEKYDTHINNPQLMDSAFKQFKSLPKKIRELFWKIKPEEAKEKYRTSFKSLPTGSLLVAEGEEQVKGEGEEKEINKEKEDIDISDIDW